MMLPSWNAWVFSCRNFPLRIPARSITSERNVAQPLLEAASEDVVANWRLVGLLLPQTFHSGLKLGIKIERTVAHFLLHIVEGLAYSRGGERAPSLSEDLHQILGEVATSQIVM